MRNHLNQTFKDGKLVESVTVPWTLIDYSEAIESSKGVERSALLTERATLLGVPSMLARIDEVADAKRMQFLGDVTRAFEYQAAERDAKAYAAANFSGDVPSTVQAWADAAGFTPKQAAENILAEAAQYNAALNGIRAIRLQGKQAVRTLPEKDAIKAYMQAIAALEGIGQ